MCNKTISMHHFYHVTCLLTSPWLSSSFPRILTTAFSSFLSLVTHHKFGEFCVELLLLWHGGGGGDGLQAEAAAAVVRHAVRDLGRLRLAAAETAAPAAARLLAASATAATGCRRRLGRTSTIYITETETDMIINTKLR